MAPAGAVRLLRCVVGAARVGFDLARVVGVERGDRIAPAPDLPGAAGRLDARGGRWPVYPLGAWFQNPDADPRRGQVVLFDLPAGRVGFAVDRVLPAAAVDRAGVFPPPPALGPVAARLTAGVVMDDGHPVAVLDPERVARMAADEPDDDLPTPLTPRRPAGKAAAGGRVLLLGVGELPGGRPVAVVLPAAQVAEILTGIEARPAPAAEDHVAGLFAWRGRPRALWDAAAWAGLRSPGGRAGKVVVAAVGGGTVGLLATDARMVPADTPTVPSRRPLDLRADRVAGVYDTTDTTLLDLAWPAGA